MRRPYERDGEQAAYAAAILIEMSAVKRLRSLDRRRRLRAYARTEATPRQLVIELNAEGTDYTVHAAPAAGTSLARWAEVEAILARAFTKLTHPDIIAQWPEDRAPPRRTTLYRWLRAATDEGLLHCSGTGERGDPYRYWLPQRAPLIRPDDGASDAEMQAWHNRYKEELFAHLERTRAAQQTPPPGGGA